MCRVEEVLAQVTAEHPLPQDPALLQLLLGGARLHESAQERDELPVLLRHCGGKSTQLPLDKNTHFHAVVACLRPQPPPAGLTLEINRP